MLVYICKEDKELKKGLVKMKKKTIMIEAHKIARKTVQAVGDYMVALKLALKQIWAKVKAGEKIYTGPKFIWFNNQYGIPEWLLKKNLRSDIYSFAIDEPEDVEVVRETEKALLLDLVTGFGTYKMWAPKSVVKGF